jgi:hypothetical protein
MGQLARHLLARCPCPWMTEEGGLPFEHAGTKRRGKVHRLWRGEANKELDSHFPLLFLAQISIRSSGRGVELLALPLYFTPCRSIFYLEPSVYHYGIGVFFLLVLPGWVADWLFRC